MSKFYKLFDTHCHIGLGASYGKRAPKVPLGDKAFRNTDDEEGCVADFTKAAQSNVTRAVVVGIDQETSLMASRIASHLNGLGLGATAYSTSGIHPHSAQYFSSQFEGVTKLVEGGGVVAVGETGLDYFKSTAHADPQMKSFEAHIELAQKHHLPLIIHCRNADEDMASTLSHWYSGYQGGIPGVLHCFSSNKFWMRQYLQLGFYISFCGNVTYPRGRALQEACMQCPLDRIVIETDSPFLPPTIPTSDDRRRRNEPANVIHTFDFICKLRGVHEHEREAFAEQLWRNSCRLFDLDP